MKVKTTIWEGCYDNGLKGFIVPDAFAHPAKYSLGLVERIFDYCLERGYLHKGEVVGDCFGGVAIGGLVAAYHGLRWVGVELEPKFVGLCRANIKLHRSKLEYLGFPLPVIMQGDSRQFHTHVQASGIVTSPPYADSIDRPSGIDPEKVKKPGGPNGNTFMDNYGQTPGQIGALKPGDVHGVVSSPPWENNAVGHCGGDKWRDPKKAAAAMAANDNSKPNRKAVSVKAREAQFERDANKTYGDSPGQIGKEKGETYWQAMDSVYRSCFLAIKPGGYIVLVLKDYVKGGKRVPLCDDTCRLLEHVGFQMVERIHAMLVKETKHGDLFNGETVSTKSRKSFFRRLAEKNGSPKIDFEEVLIAQKPT